MRYLFDGAVMPDGSIKYLITDGAFIKTISSERPEGIFDRVINCRDRLILPGFYNCHCHAAMTLFRGYGEDMPLQRWLEEKIWPAEDKLTPESVYTASVFAIAEMIRNGTVSFSDMYFFCDETVRAAEESGIKANISRSIVSFDPDADPSKDERFLESKALFENYHNIGNGRIKIDMSLHAEYTNTARMCRHVAEYAKKTGAGIQIHLSETEKEHRECIERNGKTPAEFFESTGVFDVPATAAHCVWLTENDMDILSSHNVTAAHNPVSNLKLGSGVMPLAKMTDHKVNIALGTDGAASNNTLSVLKEMQTAAVLHKGIELSPERHTANGFIKMATENGAAAQGRFDCGKLEEGCRADIILIALDDINNIPSYNPEYTAVYSAENSNIRLTMADGEILYENGEYKTIDIEKTIFNMRNACEHYFK